MKKAMTLAFPFWGLLPFAVSVGVACFGAAVEIALTISYSFAQTFGWTWGESLKPAEDSRFTIVARCPIL